ncbi:hypothetical protein DNV67_18845 [Salmonella enterica subsp. enterica serovar Napoli]|nr:hypothetical protein [Salmonella enterica]EBR0212902.1 hypothetical protein [Salmonella enterica subsp. enterica serovar Napoli]ECJ5030934.1 hypothetical protein [Salmonella enterica subsp. enterica]EEY1712722.1 hypothetical protein [Escherichia coli]EBL2394104.1 hypothetical protein [Salmonella enterica]
MEKKDYFYNPRLYRGRYQTGRLQDNGTTRKSGYFLAGMLSGAFLMLTMLFIAPRMVTDMLAWCFNLVLR